MSTTAIPNSIEQALQEIRDPLGDACMFTAGAVPARNRNDYSGQSATQPLAAVRPADTAGVATALRICHAHGLAVVPQGGLTGLCGGARANANELELSLERLVGIEEI